MIDVINKRKYFFGFSGTLVLVSLILILVFGLKQGIDLRGGTKWQVNFPQSELHEDDLRKVLSEANPTLDFSINNLGEKSFIIRLPDLSEEDHQKYLEALRGLGVVREENFSSIGPAVGSELRQKSLWALIFVMIGISLYVAWAFRKVSEPVKSWKYGVVTLVTLFHDVAIPTGLLAFLGHWLGVEIDTNFIVALLVVMGFSVHDTIVVFDRIRENLLLNRGRGLVLSQIINQSISETIARSINTSLTLILVLFAMLIFGPSSLFYFILTVLLGTVFGTYSSIFVASPLLYVWRGKGAV
ncbi:MAG: protein translocase subunit SecF [Patescibacteria group bacterium]